MAYVRPFLCVAVLALLTAGALAAPVTVPFVGCASDGQQGAVAAPKGAPVAVDLDAKTASHLAFYKSQYDDGVLAPRGWHCANLEGSGGWFTIVALQPINPALLLRPDFRGVESPAVQISMSNGGTSGRFEVARLVARYFPAHHDVLQRVLDEGAVPAAEFPAGPFKADRFVSSRTDIAEYLTPAGTQGLGTASRLAPSALPVHAAAAVTGTGGELDGFVFAARLPEERDTLSPVLIGWAEQHYLVQK
jgi:hypothetical protein